MRHVVTEENSNISWHCRCCVVVLTAGARSSEGWTDKEGRAAGKATPQCVLFPCGDGRRKDFWENAL